MLLSCGVKSDDDFLRVHRKGGAESSEKGAREQTDHRTKEGENFLRVKERELTVGIDQTTNVFFHPQKRRIREFCISLLSPREIYFDVSLKLVTTKHLWKAARVSDLRATTTHQLLNNNRE